MSMPWKSAMFGVVLFTCPLAAQVTQLSIGAGSATDARGIRSNALTLAPSIAWQPTALSTIALGVSATTFEHQAWSLGGGASVATRAPLSSALAWTFNAAADASHTSYSATFLNGDLTPALEGSWHALTVFGGAHAAVGHTQIPQSSSITPLTTPTTTLVSETRTSVAPLYGARLRLRFPESNGAPSPYASAPTLALSYREEPMHIAHIAITDRTASAALITEHVTIAGTAGQRRAPDEQIDFASGTLSLALSHAIALDIGGGRYPSNRLTGAAAGRFVSAGFSLRFGNSAGTTPSLPAPAGVHPPAPGTTRLSLHAPDAARVEIAGDWNHWTLTPATRAANGVWFVDLALPPGEYRYAFRVDGGAWRVPKGVIAVDDGFGSTSAYVTVRGTGTT